MGSVQWEGNGAYRGPPVFLAALFKEKKKKVKLFLKVSFI